MPSSIQFIHRNHQEQKDPEHGKWDALFTTENAETALHFHAGIPGYQATPLVNLEQLAGYLGVQSFMVKDESGRFSLNAFKSLGGSFCIACCIAEKLGTDIKGLTFEKLISPEVQGRIKDMVFVTATDGNHGRGIAWFSHCLGLEAHVFMPQGSAEERLQNIRRLGAEAVITDFNYDDTVRYAQKMAEENGWILVQDTAWPGYEKIPCRIMQGYLTMALEAFREMPEPPTHIFLQAGVGSMAGAVSAFDADYYGTQKPIITIVEANAADCIFRTAKANDGRLHKVDGDLRTIMAGLACGEPSTVAWEELKVHADNFVSIPDYAAAEGMRILGNPLLGDTRIISGESGASTAGFVTEVLRKPGYENIREQLHLDQNSRILCFSTEGDTDRQNYRRIVWDGLHPSFSTE